MVAEVPEALLIFINRLLCFSVGLYATFTHHITSSVLLAVGVVEPPAPDICQEQSLILLYY